MPINLADPHAQNFILTIAVGATTGLIVSGVVHAFEQFISKVVLPSHENLVYHDAKIEGTWDGQATISGESVKRRWQISRQGHDVEATIASLSGSDQGQGFKMKGSFKNLLLTGTYTHTDPSNTARGTYTFKLVGDGHKFEGMIAYYSTSAEKVEHGPYTLTRSTGKS